MTAFKQSDVERAIKAVESRKLPVAGVEIAPDGTIRVLTRDTAEPQDELECWRRARDEGKLERAQPRRQAAG